MRNTKKSHILASIGLSLLLCVLAGVLYSQLSRPRNVVTFAASPAPIPVPPPAAPAPQRLGTPAPARSPARQGPAPKPAAGLPPSFGVFAPTASLDRSKPETVHVPKATLTTREAATETQLAIENKQPELPKFVMSMCRDLQGNLWVGAEDDGIFRYDVSTKKWTQFLEKDGLGDNNGYAVACDRLGRIWVGHLNHGVSVYNGHRWKNFALENGPIGQRVFDIAINPNSGDVWIATDAGLSVYTDETREWRDQTLADGLPSNQLRKIAFGTDGTVFVATQCDGIAVAESGNNSWRWTTIDSFRKVFLFGTVHNPGNVLPAILINDMIVTKDRILIVATVKGIVWSSDLGQNWNCTKFSPIEMPLSSTENISDKTLFTILQETYVRSLAEDSDGNIWAGYRECGWGIIRRAAKQSPPFDQSVIRSDSFVTDILFEPERAFVATYGDGLAVLETSPSKPTSISTHQQIPKPSQMPAARCHKLTPDFQIKDVREGNTSRRNNVLDDWSTQGDWVGRYGKRHAVLAAMFGAYDSIHESVPGSKATISLETENKDVIRRWVAKLTTSNPKALYDPSLGLRRQAEWDDHGESYSKQIDGPSLKLTIGIPAGLHQVSLYFINDDGHSGRNRYRDYLVTVRNASSSPKDSPIIVTRVSDFWGGVYKSFALDGPNNYCIVIEKNNSVNTICSAIFIDLLQGPHLKQDLLPQVSLGGLLVGPKDLNVVTKRTPESLRPIIQEFQQLEEGAFHRKEFVDNSITGNYYRNTCDTPELSEFAAALRVKIRYYPKDDRLLFAEEVFAAWERHRLQNIQPANALTTDRMQK